MSWWKKLPWWKKAIFPFVYAVAMVLYFLFWTIDKIKKTPSYWEIVGIQKEKIFIKEI